MHIDIKDYILSLKHQKFRSVIIYHNNNSALELFLIQSSIKTDGYHIDMLNYFQQDPELIKSLDSFSVIKLKNILVKLTKGYSIVFLTNLNFLFDTWGITEKMDFATFVEKQWNSFYSENAATLVFGLQTDNWLEKLKIIDTEGRSRVHKLNEFKAIRL